jgi:transposase
MPPRAEVVLSELEREVLERWARRPKSAQALALRCRIVLAAAEGESSTQIAVRLGCGTDTVGKWRGRFARRGVDGLHDEPRPGKPRSISDEDVERVIVKTLEEQPQGATHWSTRSMAQATGMSQTAVSRIWRAFALKPHQTETFKLSPDPQFIDKVRDIVGLYLNPPDAAVVLCVDQKSQIQALDRSAPMLPLMPGVPARHTHDYVRNGTTNLYAALDLASGHVIAETTPRQRRRARG